MDLPKEPKEEKKYLFIKKPCGIECPFEEADGIITCCSWIKIVL